MKGNGFRIIDADGHVLEHPTAMLEHAPAKWRDRIFHLETLADGREVVHYAGHTTSANYLAVAGTGGMSKEERMRAAAGKLKYTEIKPGAFDPKARLQEVAIDDIQQSVVYPTLMLGLPGFADPEFAEVQARAYNRWVADYCRYSPTRLFGVAAVPQQDIARSVSVIKEAKELGLVGVFLRPNPNEPGKYFSDASYDPIWQTCQDLDLTIGFHPYLAADMPGACRDLHFWSYRAPGGSVDFVEAMSQSPITKLHNIFFSQGLSNPFDMMTTIAVLIGGGVLERFPKLRVIFLECNGGWIAPFLERLDHHYEIFGWDVPLVKMKPSDYFKRQCWISFDPDESFLKVTAEHPLVGADRIIWASDYPHPDAKIPGVVKELREAMDGLDAGKQARIFGLNAVDLYKLPAVSL
jgi:predicted TIM-barrel fold metal-dependent hydrolase